MYNRLMYFRRDRWEEIKQRTNMHIPVTRGKTIEQGRPGEGAGVE